MKSSHRLMAEEKLLRTIFGEEPKEECSGCYFSGKRPILEIYPKDGEGYPFRDNPRNAERGILDIFDGIEGYLSYTLAEDFKSREAAQDIMIQMNARIDSYLDEHMGKTTPEKMQRFQVDHMKKVFGKMDPEKYEKYYESAMAHLDPERNVVHRGLDGAIKFAAQEEAKLDVIDKLERELLAVKAEHLEAKKQLAESELKRKALSEKLLKEQESHNRQSKDLTKEIKALEHRMAEMERKALFGDQDDGR